MKQPYRHYWQVIVKSKEIYAGHSETTMKSIMAAWVVSREPEAVEIWRDGKPFVTVSAVVHPEAMEQEAEG